MHGWSQIRDEIDGHKVVYECVGWYAVSVDDVWLYDKNGTRRLFKTTEAAAKAAKAHIKSN